MTLFLVFKLLKGLHNITSSMLFHHDLESIMRV